MSKYPILCNESIPFEMLSTASGFQSAVTFFTIASKSLQIFFYYLHLPQVQRCVPRSGDWLNSGLEREGEGDKARQTLSSLAVSIEWDSG
jgi:hypothetical protein